MGDGLGKLITRVVVSLVDYAAQRVVDAVTARRPTYPPPEPVRPKPKLRPARKPREHHVWVSYDDDGHLMEPARCDNCDCDRTLSNRFDACPGRTVARFS